jgi:hypothetical protein
MLPIVIRLLGATVPAFPRADEATIYGKPNAATDTPAAFARKRRRLILLLLLITNLPATVALANPKQSV